MGRLSDDQTLYLGKSITARSPNQAQIDDDLLARAVQDSGLHAFGCVFAEVWVLSSDEQHLTRPSGGHWMDPVLIQTAFNPDDAKEVDRVARDCAPGESLAGTLFNQTSQSTFLGKNWRGVHWRDIKSMMNDPFLLQSKDNRMEKLHDLGIGIVATVPFKFQGREGIVLFMSRSGADVAKLTADHNEDFLIGATDLIGAAFAVRIPRMECSRIRRETFQSAIEKVQMQIKEKKAGRPSFATAVRKAAETRRTGAKPMPQSNQYGSSITISEGTADQPGDNITGSLIEETAGQKSAGNRVKDWLRELGNGLKNSVRKWKGAGLHAAPRQSFGECLIIFGGIFCVMLALVEYSIAFQEDDRWWTVDPGWYASSLCILFAMTAAPAGQPTQVMCAHFWCALVGIACQKIPTNDIDIRSFSEYINTPPEMRNGLALPVYWKQAFSVAVAVSGMAYLGIIHPPASGLAFTFAMTRNAWGFNNILMVLFGDVIMILFSMVILNLFQSKQYPMFWFGYNWTCPGWELFRKRTKRSRDQTEIDEDDAARIEGIVIE